MDTHVTLSPATHSFASTDLHDLTVYMRCVMTCLAAPCDVCVCVCVLTGCVAPLLPLRLVYLLSPIHALGMRGLRPQAHVRVDPLPHSLAISTVRTHTHTHPVMYAYGLRWAEMG